MTSAFVSHGITITLDDLIKMLDTTAEADWETDVVRSEDGSRNCFFGHLHRFSAAQASTLDAEIIPEILRRSNPDLTASDWFASQLWDWFESAWATTYAVYPVNDGTDHRYPQPTPRQRVIAYLRDLRSGRQMTTMESMDEQYEGRLGDEQCGVAYEHDLFPHEARGSAVCRRCDAEVTTEMSPA